MAVPTTVPDTTTFDLRDVVACVEGLEKTNTDGYSLQDCYDDSDESYFDTAYYEDSTDLYAFRNYGPNGWFVSLYNQDDRTLDDIDYSLGGNTDFTIKLEADLTKGTPIGGNVAWDSAIYDSSFNHIVTLQSGTDTYLDNTESTQTIQYGVTSSLRTMLTSAGYTGSKLGTFYYMLGLDDYAMSKLKYPAVDTYDLGAGSRIEFYFKFTIVESIDPESFDLDESAYSNRIINVSAEGSYTVSSPPLSTWLTLDDTSGSDNDTVSFDVAAKPSYGVRSADITITTSTNIFTCTVTQEYEEPSISANPSSFQFDATTDLTKVSTITCTPNANNWSIVVLSVPSWITAVKTNSTTLTVTASSNLTGSPRSGNFTIRNTDDTAYTETIYVQQAPEIT